jgi:hypothetical protein
MHTSKKSGKGGMVKPKVKASGETIKVAREFGQYGYHKNKGKIYPRTPPGNHMTLSRRLSRQILKGSPIGSPIVAAKLDFSS